MDYPQAESKFPCQPREGVENSAPLGVESAELFRSIVVLAWGEECNEGRMENKRVRLLISGQVQGVFFRACTRDKAAQEGVTGWVRNLVDGRVEVLLEGSTERVDRVIAWCQQGSPGSRVDQVDMQYQPYQGEFSSFDIRYRER